MSSDAAADPQTCFVCGEPLGPEETYRPVQGWAHNPGGGKVPDLDDWAEVEQAEDAGVCPECVWEISTGVSASPPDYVEEVE
jgi:hypothetical protein